MNTAEALYDLCSYRSSRDGELKVLLKLDKTAPIEERPLRDLTKAPYFCPNHYRFAFLHTDIDEGDKAELFDPGYYEGRNLPRPNAVVGTSRGAHVLYALQWPVALHGKGRRYFQAVRDSVNVAVNGDFSCSPRSAIRNPFFGEAEVAFFRRLAA